MTDTPMEEISHTLDLTPTDVTGGRETSRRSRPLFRERSFVALLTGQFISLLGNSVYGLALLWEMRILTGSTVMMSTVLIANLVPWLLLGPFAGVMVDRWSKRHAMIWSDVIRAGVIGLLTLVLALHGMTPWLLITASAVNSAVSSVFSPAQSALLPLIAGKERLQQANSMSQTAMVLTQMAGPALGGFLVAHVSMTAAFAANALSFVVSVISLLFVSSGEPARETRPLNGRQMAVEMKEGVEVIRQIPILRVLIPVALLANFLFAPFELILIQYCTVVLHGGAQLFGTFGSCFAVGMLLGAVLSGVITRKVRRGTLISLAFPLTSIGMLALAFTRHIWLALVLAAVIGFFNMMVNVTLSTIIQVAVPQDKMGRVFGSLGLAIQGAQPVGQAMTGYLLTILTTPTLMAVLSLLQTINAGYAAARKVVRTQT